MIYIVQVITKYKSALNIINCMKIYSMTKSDSKVLPIVNNANNAENMAKPAASESILKADCIKTDSSTKAI